LGFNEELGNRWRGFLVELNKALIRLMDELETLAWATHPSGGTYSSKLGYLSLQERNDCQ